MQAGDRIAFEWGKKVIKGTIVKISEENKALILWDNGGQSWHDISKHISEVEYKQWQHTA